MAVMSEALSGKAAVLAAMVNGECADGDGEVRRASVGGDGESAVGEGGSVVGDGGSACGDGGSVGCDG